MTKQSAVVADPNYRAVLNHGFIGIVDYMGSDSAIVQAARVSYGGGTKSVSSDRALIRYLLRHRHTTPLEMIEVKFHIRAPIFVIRQWVRHRTSSTNEESARYSEMTDEFYLPERQHIAPQSKDNKQGRVGEVTGFNASGVLDLMEASYDHSYDSYRTLLDGGNAAEHSELVGDLKKLPLFTEDFDGVARELARTVLPVATYSEFYWKLNLWNLMNFLRLRADPHAQYEIRVYAEAIIDLVRPLFPMAMEAFEDYIHGAVTISRMELQLMRDILSVHDGLQGSSANEVFRDEIDINGGMKVFAASRGMTERELREFMGTFGLDNS